MVLSTGFALFCAGKIVKNREKKCFFQERRKNGRQKRVTGTSAIPGLEKPTAGVFDNPVGCRTRLAVFQAKPWLKRGFG
jgi:hypothetical protein